MQQTACQGAEAVEQTAPPLARETRGLRSLPVSPFGRTRKGRMARPPREAVRSRRIHGFRASEIDEAAPTGTTEASDLLLPVPPVVPNILDELPSPPHRFRRWTKRGRESEGNTLFDR